MSAFSPLQEDAIRALLGLWGSDRIVLVGGGALAALTGMPWRTTLDIDFVVMADAQVSTQQLSTLEGWVKHPSRDPRWVYRGGVSVDVVPVTPENLRTGELRWPRSGAVMNTVGLELASKLATAVELSDGSTLRVAPVAVIAVLKMVSFLDRPYDRTRDLADIAWIMEGDLPATDDRRFDPRYDGFDIRYDESPAFVTGEQLRAIASVHASLVDRFLRTVEDHWLRVITASAPRAWGNDPDAVKRQLRAFRIGFFGADA